MDDSESPPDRALLIKEVIQLEAECAALVSERQARRGKKVGLMATGRRFILRMALGKKLSRAMAKLLVSLRERKGPVLGEELAQTLDAATMKLIGYKRWMVFFGGLAALPGIISVVLLWQQNMTVVSTKEKVISDTDVLDRFLALSSIYTSTSKTETGMLTTPLYNPQQRREAVLRLMDTEPKRMPPLDPENDPYELRQMIDLSIAPLNDVDFSALPGIEPIKFRYAGFNNSNFENASFAHCVFEKSWFSAAYLINTNFVGATFSKVLFDEALILGTDFTGATFEGCDFSKARYDSATKWPDGFDPVAAGATLIKEEGE